MLLSAVAGLVACSGSSGAVGAADAGATGGPDASPAAQIAGFDFALKEGDFWEFGWKQEKTVFAITGGSDTKTSGTFRVALGAPTPIAGVTAYPLVFSGAGDFVQGRWSYVALHDSVLYASSDGATLQQIFNAQLGSVPGNGFFENLGGALFEAYHGSMSNDFMKDSDVYEISQSASSSQCQYFPGVGTICGSSGSDKTVHEYYKAGIGPVGYSYRFAYSSGSGDSYFATTTTKQVGLVLSSLRGDVAGHVLEVNPNGTLAHAMPLSPPVEVHGDGSWGGAVTPTVVPLRSTVESEPNDSAQTAQVIALPNAVTGDTAVADPGPTIGFPGGDEVVQDWFTFSTTTAASSANPLLVKLDFSTGPQADLDVYVVDQGVTTILGASDADNLTTGTFSESVRMTQLAAGTYLLLVVDFPNPAASPGVRAHYSLEVGFSSTPNDLSVTEWFAVTLPAPRRIVVDASNGWGAVVVSGDGAQTLGWGLPTADAGAATAATPVLQPGTYAIGLGRTKYSKTTPFTMTVRVE